MYDFLETSIRENYDRYRLIRQTERGSVEIIRHRKSGRKYILRSFSGSGNAYEQLKTIHCPYLPEIYECAKKDDRVLVLEEYICGDTLQTLLECGPVDKKLARKISEQLCSALWVLHHIGLVHRDVKPANVMIRGEDAILIDFDTTRVYKQEQGGDTQVLGTVGYAPPEQFGISQTDPRSDIYALGVLMNEMLTGVHPSIKIAPGKMGFIIRRCTMTNPKNRFGNVLQIRALL